MMMKNWQHNILHQLSETMDSLWRMDQYIKDAEGEGKTDEVEFWKEFKGTLEDQLRMLKERLEKIIKEEGLEID